MKKLLFLLLILIAGCKMNDKKPLPESFVNSSHLDRLYEQIDVAGKSMGIIHIYSEYPDYHWVWEDHEGIACIDDAARAAIFYIRYYDYTKKEKYLQKAKQLTEFLLYMQAENGYFYNFILEDFSINKLYKRSAATPNWWTWRALWALSEVRKILYLKDHKFAERIFASMTETINAVKREYDLEIKYRDVEGLRIPAWLPSGGAADQGALLVLGLHDYYTEYPDPHLLQIIQTMCEGIARMQVGDSLQFPHNAFLSWQNSWHAWGSVQSYVLLKTHPILHQNQYYSGALKEIDHFYTYLINNNYSCEFSIKKSDEKISTIYSKKAPQIAYGIRPMVYACLEAYKQSGDTSYTTMAGKIGSWLFGDNFVGKKMYNPHTGLCYDGINENGEINKNSGAESTIEALLALLALEKVPSAQQVLVDYYRDNLH